MASAAVKNNGLNENSTKSASGKNVNLHLKELSGSRKKSRGGASSKSSRSSRSGSSKRSGKGASREKKGAKQGDKSSSTKRRSSSRSGSSSAKKKSAAKKKGLSRNETIKLSCGSDTYYVSAAHFAACSGLIKKELAVNAHARSVDLRQFDKTTVRVLAEYIESKKIKTDISFYSLAELLKFSKVFEMENLRVQLEKFITVIASNDLATLHQVLLIIGITPVSRTTEKAILARAARNFSEMAAVNTFQRIPFSIAVTLFARCDLNVKSEIQVVDAMLLWLAGQANLPSVVPSLFYLVRHDFLHSIQKAFVIERARALRFPDDVVRMVERCFECRNGARICILREHHDAKYARCGVPDPSLLEAKNPEMPLSLPRDSILYKPAEVDGSAAVSSSSSAKKSRSSSKARSSSQAARPFYHAPPACAGANKSKSRSRKNTKSSRAAAKKKSSKSSTRSSSSKRKARSVNSKKSGGSSRSQKDRKSTGSSSRSQKDKSSSSRKPKPAAAPRAPEARKMPPSQ